MKLFAGYKAGHDSYFMLVNCFVYSSFLKKYVLYLSETSVYFNGTYSVIYKNINFLMIKISRIDNFIARFYIFLKIIKLLHQLLILFVGTLTYLKSGTFALIVSFNIYYNK
jgi:hypothetical protein